MSSFERLKITGATEGGFVPTPLTASGSGDTRDVFVPTATHGYVEEVPEPPGSSEEEIRAEAYADGFEAGTAQLPWKEVESVRGLMETLDDALNGVVDLRRDYLVDQRIVVVELAIAIAEKLVRRSVEADATVLESIVERAASALSDEPKLRIAVSDADFEMLQAGMSEMLASLREAGNAEIEADAVLERGDVIVAGQQGSVDAKVATLLAHVKDSLSDLYGTREATT